MTEERLQKYLASAGVGSRRFAETLILAGRVRVNGRIVTELGTKVDPHKSRVELDGRRVVAQPFVYLVLHKPRGCVSTLSDPEGRETVAGLVTGVGGRVVPVGRLDYSSSGVLLMTNDGDFMAKLLHPRGGAEKIYNVKVKGHVDERGLQKWQRSIEIDGKQTRPAKVRILEIVEDKTWLEVILHEGRNRQIHRLGDEAGYPVMRLIRVSYAGITVDDVRPGAWRFLTRDELIDLRKKFGVPQHLPSAPIRVAAGRGQRQQPMKPVPTVASRGIRSAAGRTSAAMGKTEYRGGNTRSAAAGAAKHGDRRRPSSRTR